jgi:hypothetical protein
MLGYPFMVTIKTMKVHHVPLYFVLDISQSMGVTTKDQPTPPIQALQRLTPLLHQLDNDHPSLENLLSISTYTFAEQTLPITRRAKIENFPELSSLRPDGLTYFANMFDRIKADIEEDWQIWEMTRKPHEQSTRPVVYIFTDGRPSDSKEKVDAAFRSLCPIDIYGEPSPKRFAYYPHIQIYAVGDAYVEILRDYTFAGGTVVEPNDDQSVYAQLNEAVLKLVGSIHPMLLMLEKTHLNPSGTIVDLPHESFRQPARKKIDIDKLLGD